MDMTGERRIAAPRLTVWDALNDPEVLRASIPGCESLDRQSDTAMKATAAVRIGPISARFTGDVLLSDIDPPNSYRISGEGQGGVAGFAKGGAKVDLADDGSGTLLRYEVHAHVGGKLAQLGARLVDASAKQMADQFFDRFTARVAGPAAPGAAPQAASSAAGATTTPSPAAKTPEPIPVSADHQRAFPSAPGSVVSEPVLPPPYPPASVSIFSMIPREPYGLPIVAWIGCAIYIFILLVYLVSVF